ncbi:unnamed protein product, partial [Scytosiphon promiscuus]
EERAADLERQADAAFAEYDKLEGQIKQAENLERIERDLSERANQPDPSRRPDMGPGSAPGADGGVATDYRSAFASYMRAMGNTALLPPEERAILQAGYDQLTPEQRAQTTTNAAGGYTVPEEMMSILIKTMAAWGPMYNDDICTTIETTSGASIDLPTVDDTGVDAAASGGEAVTLTDDGGKDVTFGQKSLGGFSFDTEWLRVSKELADDSIFALEKLLGELLGERIGRLANLQLTTCSGSGAPNGIVTASGLGKTAAGTAAITFDEVMDLEHSVDPAYREGPKVRFMFNDSTLLAMRKLKDGDGNYLWQMGNVQKGVPASFNNRAYSINQAMDSLASAKKVMLFGDFGKYYVRKIGGVLIGAIQDKDFWPGFGVAGYARFDGELGDTGAVKHLITA